VVVVVGEKEREREKVKRTKERRKRKTLEFREGQRLIQLNLRERSNICKRPFQAPSPSTLPRLSLPFNRRRLPLSSFSLSLALLARKNGPTSNDFLTEAAGSPTQRSRDTVAWRGACHSGQLAVMLRRVEVAVFSRVLSSEKPKAVKEQ
jgi:hypothetical protein